MREFAYRAVLFPGVAAATLFCALAANASQSTSTASFSYDYVRVTYDHARFADENGPVGRFPKAGGGVALAASFEIGHRLHIWGGVEFYGEESYWRPPVICVVPCSSRVESDTTVVSGGLGYAVDLSAEVNMFLRVGPAVWKVGGKDIPDFDRHPTRSLDESYYGWRIGVGARVVVAPRVELFAEFGQWEVEDRPSTPSLVHSTDYLVESETTFGGGLEFRPIDRIGLRFSAEMNTDDDLDASIGIVWRF